MFFHKTFCGSPEYLYSKPFNCCLEARDDGQIAHLICVRLKYLLSSWGGALAFLFFSSFSLGHTPSTAGTFRKKLRKNTGKTPETLSERFLEFFLESTAGIPQAL